MKDYRAKLALLSRCIPGIKYKPRMPKAPNLFTKMGKVGAVGAILSVWTTKENIAQMNNAQNAMKENQTQYFRLQAEHADLERQMAEWIKKLEQCMSGSKIISTLVNP
jgi:hypothetical protein